MTTLFASSPGERIPWMVGGQLAGFVLVLATSAAVTAGLATVPASWCALFGLVPLGIGLRGFWTLGRDDDVAAASLAPGFLGVVVLMIGNGGDNVAVLAPLFRALGLARSLFVAGVLLVLDGAMCATALRAGRSSLLVRAFERAGHAVVPTVYCAIGIALLVRAGTLSSFAGLH